MGWHGIGSLILVTDIIAVVNNGLRAMNKVTRGFPCHLVAFVSTRDVFEFLVCNSRCAIVLIQVSQNGVIVT